MKKIIIIKWISAAMFAGSGYFLGDLIFFKMREMGVFITGTTWAFLFFGMPIIFFIIGFGLSDFYFFTYKRYEK